MLKQDTMVPDFTHQDARIRELLDCVHEISDLNALSALAEWDQNTSMPGGAGEMRGDQMATLQGVLHERWTAPRLGQLLQELTEVVAQDSFTDADRGLVRQTRRSYEHATKLPRKLVEEMARVQAASFEAWRRARENNDFASFAPWLKRIVLLQREIADHLGYDETRYDALLDQFEPGMTASKLDRLFAPIREVSLMMLRRIQQSGHTIDDSCLTGDFALEEQVVLSKTLLRNMGYDFSFGGIAESPHPFTTSFGSPFDVRLTIHPDRHFIQPAVMAAIHEGGHALYEQGSAQTLARTPVAGGASMGAHESQSRLWENPIGRSLPFWQGQYSAVLASFPQHFASVDISTYVRALNKVQPSLIRIEADEVTYNLHILIRFELEKALINGDVAVESLPGLWNAKYREYLGIEPANDAEGVLQDIHWSSGFGYFPTYTLGNLYAAQFMAAARRDLPGLDDDFRRGDFARLKGWLTANIYGHGQRYRANELCRRVTGEPLDHRPFLDYLRGRYEPLYGL